MNRRFHINVYASRKRRRGSRYVIRFRRRPERHASPIVTVVFHVVRRWYHAGTSIPLHVIDHDSTHEFNCPLPAPPADQFGSTDPVVWDGAVSVMLDAVRIPFPVRQHVLGGIPVAEPR